MSDVGLMAKAKWNHAYTQGLNKARKQNQVEAGVSRVDEGEKTVRPTKEEDEVDAVTADEVKRMRDSGAVAYLLSAVAFLACYTAVKYFVEPSPKKQIITAFLAVAAGLCVWRCGSVMNDLGYTNSMHDDDKED